jgi:23S rRNA (adenine2503-C2)-methyltransferase
MENVKEQVGMQTGLDEGQDALEGVSLQVEGAQTEQLDDGGVAAKTHIAASQTSKDGSRKYVIEYVDGARVEAVVMPYKSDRTYTICASSQVGCAMNCGFCATGQGGFQRNLTKDELLKQVNLIINEVGPEMRLGNLVLMGMGEPFNNYDNVVGFLQTLNHRKRNGLGARKIAVSTAGIVRGIERFAEVTEQFRLAVSLHSVVQKTRDAIMPGLAKQPLDKLQKAMEHYIDKRHRRITLEVTLLDGINDSRAEAMAMAEFCYGEKYYLNLIPYNDYPGSPYKASRKADLYRHVLKSYGINAEIRKSRGSDIAAACGQLA